MTSIAPLSQPARTARTPSTMRAISASVAISAGASAMVSPEMRITRSCRQRRAHGLVAAPAGRGRIGLDVDGGGQADIADIGDERRVLERVHRLFQHRLQRARAREQVLVAIEIERRQRRRAGQRMARIGVAVEELDARDPGPRS